MSAFPDPPEEEAEPETVYVDHLEFYSSHFRTLFPQEPEHTPGWCPAWRKHPAADKAVDALWRSWESQQPTGEAAWWAHEAIPIMRDLVSEHGTFSGCASDRHTPMAVDLP